jgi:hypothetical protein
MTRRPRLIVKHDAFGLDTTKSRRLSLRAVFTGGTVPPGMYSNWFAPGVHMVSPCQSQVRARAELN